MSGSVSTLSTPADTARGQSLLRGLVRVARPRQWAKNVLVVAAPLAAGKVLDGTVAAKTALAAAVFCLAASGVYFLNDTLDAEADRAHPVKRFRPVAAGVVPPPVAYAVGILLIVVSLAVTGALLPVASLAVMTVYVVVQVLYCLRLKHVPIVDLVAVASGFLLRALAAVASGFLLRALAGGAATGVSPSQWFLITTGFGSLFVVTAKRASELHQMADGAGKSRKLLEVYTDSYLRFVWQGSAGIMMLSYCLWALDRNVPHSTLLRSISIIPLTMAVLRYAMLVDKGATGAPEEVILGDRMMLIFGALWAAVYGAAVFF